MPDCHFYYNCGICGSSPFISQNESAWCSNIECSRNSPQYPRERWNYINTPYPEQPTERKEGDAAVKQNPSALTSGGEEVQPSSLAAKLTENYESLDDWLKNVGYSGGQRDTIMAEVWNRFIKPLTEQPQERFVMAGEVIPEDAYAIINGEKISWKGSGCICTAPESYITRQPLPEKYRAILHGSIEPPLVQQEPDAYEKFLNEIRNHFAPRSEVTRLREALKKCRTNRAGYIITDQTREELIEIVGQMWHEIHAADKVATAALAEKEEGDICPECEGPLHPDDKWKKKINGRMVCGRCSRPELTQT